MENPIPHTLGYILLHNGLMIDKPSLLNVENLSTRVGIVLYIWRGIVLLFDLFVQSSRSLVGGRMLLMSSVFVVHFKDYKTF